MKKLRKEVRIFFLIATVIYLSLTSCKQTPNDSNPEKITITVKKDSNIKTIKPSSFEVTKGQELGLTDLKARLTIECNDGYKVSKICLENETGKIITDVSKHKFNSNTTIFVASQKETENIKFLKSIRFGTDIKRNVDMDGLKAGIANEMEFVVPFRTTEIDVEVEVVDEAGYEWETLTGDYAIEGGKLKFVENPKETAQLTTTYKLTVNKDDTKEEYKVKVIKMLTNAYFEAGMVKGVDSIDQNTTAKIVNHEEELPELTITGPELYLEFWSQSLKWKSFVVNVDNGDDINYAVTNKEHSLGLTTIPLEKGQTKEITIKIENNPVESITENGKKRIVATSGNLAREKFKFKVTRDSKTADFPANRLFIADEDVVKSASELNNTNILTSLCSQTDFPNFFVGEPCKVKVQSTKKVKTMTIDGVNITPSKTTGINGRDVYTGVHEVKDFKSAGSKDVQIVMTPENEEDYHTTTWNFKLTYSKGEPFPLSYDINGMGSILSSGIKLEIESGKNPLINVHGKSLNMEFASPNEIHNIKIGDKTITEENIAKVKRPWYGGQKDFYVATYSEKLENTTEKEITVEVTPKNTGTYEKKILKFKAKSDGQKEIMTPILQEIAREQNFSKEFMNKLTETQEDKIPEHVIKGQNTSAEIVLEVNAYDKEFLCKGVKVDNTAVEIKVDPARGGKYVAKATINDINTNAKIVNIVFEGKDGVADDINWKLKIKNGGDAPTLPQTTITTFTINEQGKNENPFLDSFKNHLTDNSKPTLQIYGKKVAIKVASGDNAWIKDVEFKIGGILKATKALELNFFEYVAQYEFELEKVNEEYEIELKFNSAKTEYSALSYTFKIRSLDEKPALNLRFGVNQTAIPNGYAGDLNVEYCEFLVQATSDSMAKVEIGEKDNPQDCTIVDFNSSVGKIYEAKADLKLATDMRKTYIIKVTPKETEKYAVTIHECTLKGKQIEQSNAEFAFNSQNKRMVTAKIIEWQDGLRAGSFKDLGITKISITAKTLSPRAKVKYKFVNALTLEDISTSSEVMLTSDNKRNHTATSITLFNDKPTKVKVWVEAENGMKDDVKGVSYFTINNLELYWGYKNSGALSDFKERAYDEIKFEKTKAKDGKIYIMIAPWNEDEHDYTVDNTGLPEGQTEFLDKGDLGFDQRLYLTSIDVSSLIDGSSSTQYKEALIKLKHEDIPCMTYKLKVRLE